MQVYKVVYEYDEYDYELRDDEDGFEYEAEVVERFEDYMHIIAVDADEAREIAYDSLDHYYGLSVLRATEVEDD